MQANHEANRTVVDGENLASSCVNLDAHTPQEIQVACYSRRQASEYIRKSNFGRALAHLFVTLRLIPEWRNELRGVFGQALSGGCQQLESEGRLEETVSLRKDALLLYPEDGILLMDLGSVYFKLDDITQSLQYYQQAITICPSLLPASRAIQSIHNKQVERWHFRMLNDLHRNEAYYRAIAHRIQEGHSTVLDVGAGTGILSLFAAEEGAEKIWACELNMHMFKIAQSVLAANNVSGRVDLINKHSSLLSVPSDIPQKVSMIVTEVFDAGLLGEGVLPMLLHAWENLLFPPGPNLSKNECGIVIPFSATVWVAAIQCIDISRRHRLLPVVCSCKESKKAVLCDNNQKSVIEFGQIRLCKLCEAPISGTYDCNKGSIQYYLDDTAIALDSSEPYTTEDLENMPSGFELLSRPYKALEINFNNVEELKALNARKSEKATVSLLIESAGSVDAIASWFHLNLDNNGTVISTAPFKESGIYQGVCWHQAIFPSLSSKTVTQGDVINLNIDTDDGILKILDGANDVSLLAVSDHVVPFLNNKTWVEALQGTAVDLVKTFSNISSSAKNILDLSPFPILGLRMLKDSDITWKLIAKAKIKADEEFILTVAEENSINVEQIQFVVDDVFKEKLDQESFDVICLDVMDTSGELAENVTDMIEFLQNRLSPHGMILPRSLSIECQMIESEKLIQESRVVSDERMRDFHVAEFINSFAVDYHLDVLYGGLKFKPLSDCVEVLKLNISPVESDTVCGQHEREHSIQSTGSGTVTGIIYWVKLCLQEGSEPISTACFDSHCNQVVHFSSLDVKSGMQVTLKCLYNYGMLEIKLLR